MRGDTGRKAPAVRARLTALALDPHLGWVAARRCLEGGAGEIPHRPDERQVLLGLERAGGRLVLLGDAEFPAALAADPAAPVGLFVRGTLPRAPLLAIVGARACTRAGERFAAALAAVAVGAGRAVVSGGAIGIDAAAHAGALAAGGATVAVLGSGLDRLYPARNRGLFERIAAQGALVTPFPPGVAPLRENFPRRNGIVAALADHVVVVEARGRSGALLTARAARARGRPVGAVPGSVGCERLIAEGARRLEAADDLAAWLRGEPPRPSRVQAPTPEAEQALAACDAVPRDLGDIAARAGLEEEEAELAMGFLELWGLVARASGDRYVRISGA